MKVEFIESYIKGENGNPDYIWNDNHGELIRCKDCKHRPKREHEGQHGFEIEFPDYICPCQCDDGFYSWYPEDEWYCANGERKDNG